MTKNTSTDRRFLRLNVGFLLKEGAGYSRDFTFDRPGTLRAEDILISDLKGILHLSRTPQGILVQGALHATTEAECVRCLESFALPFSVDLSELFIPVWQVSAGSPEGASPYLIDEKGFIDLTPILREEGILAVPIQALCSPHCKGLCPQCGQNLNEGPCDCEKEHIDPRLASLRSLLEE